MGGGIWSPNSNKIGFQGGSFRFSFLQDPAPPACSDDLPTAVSYAPTNWFQTPPPPGTCFNFHSDGGGPLPPGPPPPSPPTQASPCPPPPPSPPLQIVAALLQPRHWAIDAPSHHASADQVQAEQPPSDTPEPSPTSGDPTPDVTPTGPAAATPKAAPPVSEGDPQGPQKSGGSAQKPRGKAATGPQQRKRGGAARDGGGDDGEAYEELQWEARLADVALGALVNKLRYCLAALELCGRSVPGPEGMSPTAPLHVPRHVCIGVTRPRSRPSCVSPHGPPFGVPCMLSNGRF